MSLSSLLNKGSFSFEPLVLPSLVRIAAAAERVLLRWPDVIVEPPERDRERIVQEIKRRITTGQWQGTKMSLVMTAARAVFDEERCTRDDLEGVRRFYYDEIRASDRRGFLSAMFSVYMGSYQPGAMHTMQLARALSSSQQSLGAKWRHLLEKLPACLDPDKAHEAVCALMINMDDPWDGLRSLGIRSPHAPGLMDHAHMAFVAAIGSKLTSRAEIERLIGWLKPDNGPARTVGAGFAVSALLEPWTNSKPTEGDTSYLTENIVGLYGDPRVQHGGVWSEVSESATSVILRWLTGENIRFFLDVVSKVEDSHMWQPRREFWLRLYEAGWIEAAWVAFSQPAVQEARRISQYGGGHSTLSFGSQTERGNRQNTSLLILKIGRKIVVEGSHNYKVHIFDESDPAAPSLYQRAYSCEMIRLRGNPKSRAHLSGWQGWVMEHI